MLRAAGCIKPALAAACRRSTRGTLPIQSAACTGACRSFFTPSSVRLAAPADDKGNEKKEQQPQPAAAAPKAETPKAETPKAETPKASPQQSKAEPTAAAAAAGDKGSNSALWIGVLAALSIGAVAAYLVYTRADQQDTAGVAPKPDSGKSAAGAPAKPKKSKKEEEKKKEAAPTSEKPAAPTSDAPKSDAAAAAPASAAAPAAALTPEPAALQEPSADTASAADSVPAPAGPTPAETLQAGLASAAAASSSALQSVMDKYSTMEDRRQEVKKELQEALEARSHDRIQAALTAAKEVHLGECAETQMAAKLTEPLAMVRSMLSESGMSTPAGSKPEENLPVKSSKGLDESAARALELTAALASARLESKASFKEALASHLEASGFRSIGSLSDALANLRSEQGSTLEAELIMKALEISLRLEKEDALAKAASDEKSRAKAKLAKQLEDQAAEIAAAAQDAHSRQLRAQVSEAMMLSESLTALEATLVRSSNAVQRTANRNKLSAAIDRLEDAVLNNGQDVHAELQRLKVIAGEADRFVADMLSYIPDAAIEECQKGKASPQQYLKAGFSDQRTELATATLRPPGGGLLAELVGRCFARLYILDETAAPVSSSSDTVALTLKALSRADVSMDVSKLQQSLPEGPCRRQLDLWVDKPMTKGMLQLWNVLAIIRARIQCLHMEV